MNQQPIHPVLGRRELSVVEVIHVNGDAVSEGGDVIFGSVLPDEGWGVSPGLFPALLPVQPCKNNARIPTYRRRGATAQDLCDVLGELIWTISRRGYADPLGVSPRLERG